MHPCWPRGYSEQVQLQDLYESPCLAALRPQTFDGNSLVSVAGSGDAELCSRLVSRLFSFPTCRYSRCSFNGTFQPPVSGNFIVRGGAGGWGWGPSRRDLRPVHTGLLCLFLHCGLPEDKNEAACGHPVAAGCGGPDPL